MWSYSVLLLWLHSRTGILSQIAAFISSPSYLWSSFFCFPFQITLQHMLWHSVIFHSYDMAEPSEQSFVYYGYHFFLVCSSYYFFVSYPILVCFSLYFYELVLMECVYFPGFFCTIQLRIKITMKFFCCLVYFSQNRDWKNVL